MKDYYKILEVEEKASADEIKKSYRSLSKKYHPDVNPGGDEQFKEIAEAYDVLGNPDKKAKYDNSKSNPFQGTSYEEMFSQMFKNGRGGNNPFSQPRRKNAPDKIIKLQITPIESYLGSTKQLHYVKNNHCGICNGSGGDQQMCGTCKGQGFEVKTFGTGFMVQQIRTACNTCGGRGYTLIHKCHGCGGQGIKSNANSITITLPKGIDSGQFLKAENGGDFKNGEYGDLVIQIEVVPKDGYEKMNNDLIYNLYLNLEQVQQDKFSIPHPDGELVMSSPKIFDSSRPLRLKGKGYNGGDMYVKLNVKFERGN
jgi:molecular chaperone DnaJ